MVKSTVRFPEPVVDEIESIVDDGAFESKSEFYRFATDYVLAQIRDSYEPQTIDFQEIESEVMPAGPTESEELPFLESLALVRKFALRGELADAEDFIDHHYAAGDRHAILLEEYLDSFRSAAEAADSPHRRPPAAETPPETETE